MPNSIATKLKIKTNDRLLTINAPADFKKGLEGLPASVKISSTTKVYNQLHWFVLNKSILEKELSRVMKLLSPGIIVWVYYPKISSKLQTDLTRDKGWDCLLAGGDKLTWISLVSFNETWSVSGFRAKTDADKKKDARPKQTREVFKYVDPVNKTVHLPEDLSLLLSKHKKQAAFFEKLSFTNKKEYIEWVLTAKREETRKKRITGTLERLGKEWKNPRNI